jgi:hypothetical protein
MLLKDISIAHIKKSRKHEPDQEFIMHPFENSQGQNAGKYEILRNIDGPGERPVKRSAHVTLIELAELYAHGILKAYQIRLRLRSANNDYPTAPPGKKVSARCIAPGSEFDRMVKSISPKQPLSAGLARELVKINVGGQFRDLTKI